MMTLPKKASRHQVEDPPRRGIETSRRGSQRTSPHQLASSRRPHRAFSLIEVLLSIFILGVGIISIAALFPAGIAQQRLSSDEVSGPMVAKNALAILRGKLKQDDFGSFEDFGVLTIDTPRPTVGGDWTWLRPAVLLEDDIDTDTSPPPALGTPLKLDDHGYLDVFSNYASTQSPYNAPVHNATEFPNAATGYPLSTPPLYGVPWSRAKYGNIPPRIIIPQNDRYYPMLPKAFMTPGSSETPRPQYVWDCMFRRFQGKILVAVFVYRVTLPGGQAAAAYTTPYSTPDAIDTKVPPLPVWLDLVTDPGPGGGSPPFYSAGGAWDCFGPDDVPANADDTIVLGTRGGDPYNPNDQRQSWQEPRQWLIDQNNNVNRVLAQSRKLPADPMEIELVRPVPAMPSYFPPIYYLNYSMPSPPNDPTTDDVVSDIWYIPTQMKIDTPGPNGDFDGTADTEVTLTPVYASVQEL